jgi:hypothetical protein
MVQPRLLHPLPTDIQSVNTSATIQDDGYAEPVQTVRYETAFTVPGQWRWLSDRELRMQDNGAAEYSTGYVLLLTRDLRAQSKQVKRGDRIAGYGSGVARVDLDVYVTKLRYEGHYPSQLGPAMLKVFFSDRQPERQKPGV